MRRRPTAKTESRKPARLAIHVRTILVGDGTQKEQAIGYCPFCERSLPLASPGDRAGEAERGATKTPMRSSSIMGGRVSLRPTDAGVLATAASRTAIATVMSHDVVCVHPDLDVAAAEALFVARGIGGAPVVTGDGRLVGFVATSDLLAARRAGSGLGARGEGPAATVEEVMMPVAFALPECASLAKAAALMAFEGVHRLPIISHRGEVVGMLSALDVMRWTAQQDGYLVPSYTQRERRGVIAQARS